MKELLETWDINNRANLRLLQELSADQMAVKLTKGKSVAGQFAHLHNVRLMWLQAAAPDLHCGQTKLDDKATGKQMAKMLASSSKAVHKLIESAESPSGRIKGFKPHAAAFVGYLCAHEAYHRAHAELALRQAGVPISDKASYALWEWGTL